MLTGVINEKIKQLQPPKPTCSTCKYLFGNGCGNWQNLVLVKDEIANRPNKFGCIYHSDYEVKDESN